jgi:hypothetical protein
MAMSSTYNKVATDSPTALIIPLMETANRITLKTYSFGTPFFKDIVQITQSQAGCKNNRTGEN